MSHGGVKIVANYLPPQAGHATSRLVILFTCFHKTNTGDKEMPPADTQPAESRFDRQRSCLYT